MLTENLASTLATTYLNTKIEIGTIIELLVEIPSGLPTFCHIVSQAPEQPLGQEPSDFATTLANVYAEEKIEWVDVCVILTQNPEIFHKFIKIYHHRINQQY